MIDNLIADGRRVSAAVGETAGRLEAAMLKESDAKRSAVEAKQAYTDAEAETRYEAIINANGKNAEARSAEVDRALIQARNAGALAADWRRLNAAQRDHDAAKMALEQAVVAHKATCIVAELQSAMLRAVAR